MPGGLGTVCQLLLCRRAHWRRNRAAPGVKVGESSAEEPRCALSLTPRRDAQSVRLDTALVFRNHRPCKSLVIVEIHGGPPLRLVSGE